jgi:hypothetical protein
MDTSISDDFYDITSDLHENKYILGLMTIIIVLGSRFIINEIPEIHRETLMYNKILRKIFLFAIFFMATRNFSVSFILTIIISCIFQLVNHNVETIKKEEKTKEPTPEIIKIKTSPQLPMDNQISITSLT